MSSQAEILEQLIIGFGKVGLRYLIGGSVASSAIGIPRATLDTDILVEIDQGQVAMLAKALGPNWYVDVETASAALEVHRAFNVIDMHSGYKFDLFPAHNSFHHSELDRAVERHLRMAEDHVTCLVATAEDMILAKLAWYRDGGEVSDRQWGDVIGMLTSGKKLNTNYLTYWAEQLAVHHLLSRATAQARKGD